MAEEKLVEREMLTATYYDGKVRRRGEKVHLTEAQAKRFESINPPAVAEVGTVDKLAAEQQEAARKAGEAAERKRAAEAEEARLRGLHAQGRSVTDEPATTPAAEEPAGDPTPEKTTTARRAGK